jgi:uncharacterized protein (DUF58 family)
VTVIFDTRIPENEGEQLSLRDRIRAEQDGSVIRSERFEKGVSAAASLIGHLTAEKASVKLIIDDDTGDYGSGKQHLHECLKKFALVEPAFLSETDGRDGIFDRYAEAFEDLPGSHFYLFTAMDRNLMPAELMQNLRVIDF